MSLYFGYHILSIVFVSNAVIEYIIKMVPENDPDCLQFTKDKYYRRGICNMLPHHEMFQLCDVLLLKILTIRISFDMGNVRSKIFTLCRVTYC